MLTGAELKQDDRVIGSIMLRAAGRVAITTDQDALRQALERGVVGRDKQRYTPADGVAFVRAVVYQFSGSRIRALPIHSKERNAANFDESEHPRDEAGKFTDGAPSELTPEQQFEKDKRDYLTPGEYAKLPPGIVKWKVAKRKAEAEAKKAAGGDKKPEVKPEPPKIELKPDAPSVTERERAISERSTLLQRMDPNTPWHTAIAKARQEDLEKHGPMPANTLRERLQTISDRSSEIRQANPGMKWDEANKQARIEDVAKHGPWLEPDQVKEREALIASDKQWSVKDTIAKELEAGADKSIPPRPTIDPKERTPKQQAFETQTHQIARELGHDPKLIVVRDYAGRTFQLNGQTLTEGGHYNPHTGLIELNAGKDIDKGTVIHEIQHAQFDYVKGQADIERNALYQRWRREQADDFQGTTRYFTKDGKVMTKYAKEIEEQTPHLSLLARAGLGSRELRVAPDIEGLMRDDGVSDYSKMYWVQAAEKGGKPRDQANYMHELAVNETLSETLRRQLSHNYHSDAKFGYDTPARFKNLGKRITELYKSNPERVRRHFARKHR